MLSLSAEISKFKHEDIRTEADLFQQGDWFFKFDYRIGYHHVENFFQNMQSFLAALEWLMVPVRFLSLPFCLSAFHFVLLSLQRSKNPDEALEKAGNSFIYLS